MLHEFVTLYRDAIIERSREKLSARPWAKPTTDELENGVPLFLTQLSDRLRSTASGSPEASSPIGRSATLHGRQLLALGFTVSQVVHDYGDICQAVTELALEQHAPIDTEEFRTLNGCLDTAIAEAVTEHARITAESRSSEDVERAGQVAHETRDLLHTALLAYQALKIGTVAINGSTGAVLGRSLMSLRDLTENTLSDVRVAANIQQHERMLVSAFFNDVVATGRLHAESRGLQFSMEPVEPGLEIIADAQLLGSAVASLLSNAFKFTRAGGHVRLRAHAVADARLLIEVEDECGGISESEGDPFKPFGKRHGSDRTGLGLGLSIARKAVRAQGGDIHIRNRPGTGCVFVIDLPVVAKDAAVDAAARSL
jgi:signal transduction histidine kinase